MPRLVILIVDASIQLQSLGIDMHSMFAGTEWGKVSSNSIVRKISVSFFDLEQKLEIAAHIYPQGYRSTAFVENLHYIGHIARCAVEFCQKS